ncbi:putative F-box/LRR-repeat protein At5g02700 [Hevea brasiliensis]|uniref:putative F-box/LRR-repeat protein At5g02700 n=1 Tax=Hevea brasiliensis TaxID=3981 RepID=UPI0025E98926|nr:putative F-box/LRR-repeat protein At5g02700 [Hevea brasiliensis]
MEDSIEAVDFISKLSEPILLHRILSFLYNKEIARTSVLSKTWLQAWKTVPILKFDIRAIILENSDHWRNVQEIFNLFEQIFLNRRKQIISLIKFKLVMSYNLSIDPESASFMGRCIGYALERNVKHLKIRFGPTILAERHVHCVPQALLNAILVQDLDLSYYDNAISKLIFDLVNPVKFHVRNIARLERLEIEAPNLHSLTLHGSIWASVLKVACLKILKSLAVYRAPISDKWLQVQFNKFPHLESLSLRECHILESIKISSSSLHKLCIKSCEKVARVQIHTPNLHIFPYRGDIISSSSNDLILLEIHLYIESNNMEISWYIILIELLSKFNQYFKIVTLKSQTGESYIIPSQLRQLLPPPLHKVKELKLSTNSGGKCPIAELVDAMLGISPHLERLYLSTYVKSSFKGAGNVVTAISYYFDSREL